MEENKILSRKERERNFRRQEIINSAVKLFAEKGYEHTTLDEIAEASEFGKGTIYNYFENKEEIYLAIVEDILESHTQTIQRISDESSDFKSFLSMLTKAAIENSINNYDAFLLMVRLRTQTGSSDPSMKSGLIQKNIECNNKILSKRFEDAIKNKEIRPLKLESLLNIYRSMVFPYLHFLLCCKNAGSINPDEESEFILSVFFNGVKAK